MSIAFKSIFLFNAFLMILREGEKGQWDAKESVRKYFCFTDVAHEDPFDIKILISHKASCRKEKDKETSQRGDGKGIKETL